MKEREQRTFCSPVTSNAYDCTVTTMCVRSSNEQTAGWDATTKEYIPLERIFRIPGAIPMHHFRWYIRVSTNDLFCQLHWHGLYGIRAPLLAWVELLPTALPTINNIRGLPPLQTLTSTGNSIADDVVVGHQLHWHDATKSYRQYALPICESCFELFARIMAKYSCLINIGFTFRLLWRKKWGKSPIGCLPSFGAPFRSILVSQFKRKHLQVTFNFQT